MDSILVTGASGFIGNAVIEQLLHYPVKVIATSKNASKISDKSWNNQVDYHPLDLHAPYSDCYHYFQRPQIMLHLAWQGLPQYEKAFHYEQNMMQHYFFLKKMIEDGVQQLVVLGSCFEYGLQSGCLSENTPTHPVTAYGVAKDGLRRLLEQLQRQIPFELIWLRLFYVYGPGQPAQCLLAQLERAILDGDAHFPMSPADQLRDYLTINKAADKIVKITLQREINGIINVCSGKPITLRALAENLIKERQSKIKLALGHYPYLAYEPKDFWGNHRKGQRALLAFARQEQKKKK